jgi:hypothetical protein
MIMKWISLSAAAIFGLSSLALADEAKPLDEGKKLATTFDLTYMSKYIDKGSASYGDQGAVFETISFDLWGTGFGVFVRHQSATSSGYVEKQRLNYGVTYDGKIFNDDFYKTVYKLTWYYKDYYGQSRTINNSQEWILDFTWPELLPIKNLDPYYIVNYGYPAGSGYDNRDTAGWMHRFGLGYNLEISGLKAPIKLTSDIAYNDGLGGSSKDHDWSHSTFGAQTTYKFNKNLSFVPGIYYQISMDDSVNEDDELYCKVSMKYTF